MLWGLVVAALCAVLRRGGLAGSCATWRDVAGYWHVSGRGGGWHGGQWRLGLACCVEAVWRGLAHHVEAAWRVGGVLHDLAGVLACIGLGWGSQRVAGSCALCRDGMGAGGSWALHAVLRRCGGSAGSWHAMLGWSCTLCWGGEVGWRWQGVGAGWRWLACLIGLQRPG
ncbi:hypothetical protein EDB83DRAFT_2319698 [Lactarius deliciosus]|nr:hypothetical protein EDB83DRAFT_2319698 [Lactarius deliciosus]